MLSERQSEIVTGSLLGDGMIWTNNLPGCVNKFSVSQSKFDHIDCDKKSYLLWYVSEFMEFGCSVRPRRTEARGILCRGVSKIFDSYVFTTRCDLMWNTWEAKWYKPIQHAHWKRRKIVPLDIKLTPLTFCVWYMEDGSNYAKDANITMETQCFTESEVEFLIDRLKEDLNISATKKKTKKPHQFRIYIGRESYFNAIEIAKSIVQWSCFKYKLDTSAYTKKPHRGDNHSSSKLTEEQAREALSLKGVLKQKEVAKKFGVSQPTIAMLFGGKRWKHLQECI